jgi:hypothetical protein
MLLHANDSEPEHVTEDWLAIADEIGDAPDEPSV